MNKQHSGRTMRFFVFCRLELSEMATEPPSRKKPDLRQLGVAVGANGGKGGHIGVKQITMGFGNVDHRQLLASSTSDTHFDNRRTRIRRRTTLTTDPHNGQVAPTTAVSQFVSRARDGLC